ncbi:MAG: BMC domain-containing protein [Candidatus Marinimicrobia bacterium]|nr:BMC domain-containing protein [Candidatus Neomarinimicrobiota bacterium]
MKKYPALALIELSAISTGILTGDAMVKTAPVSVLKSGTVHDGKYLILVGGSVASVEEAFKKGLAIGGDQIIDSVFLPDVHPQVNDAILGKRLTCTEESLGIIETSSVAAVINAADAAIKGAHVKIVEIRLADDIGGKGLVIFNGKIEEVEEAISISKSVRNGQHVTLNDTLIPNFHSEMAKQLDHSSIFEKNNLEKLNGGEV